MRKSWKYRHLKAYLDVWFHQIRIISEEESSLLTENYHYSDTPTTKIDTNTLSESLTRIKNTKTSSIANYHTKIQSPINKVV